MGSKATLVADITLKIDDKFMVRTGLEKSLNMLWVLENSLKLKI